MGIMTGKKGLIFGVSNKWSIGYGIAQSLFAQGAEIGFAYAAPLEDRIKPLVADMNSPLLMSCDVTSDAEISAVFDRAKSVFDTIDFVVHSVAYANREDLTGDFIETSRAGWEVALGVSAYSLVPMAKYARPLMPNGGSVVAMTYLGGERAVPNYNVMGVAKAALDASVRYLASELGESGIRVNAISAGPIKTLAAKGISGFDILMKINQMRSPMKRNVTLEEIGNAGLFLCSDMSTGVTGEILHVDCGYHAIANSRADALLVKS